MLLLAVILLGWAFWPKEEHRWILIVNPNGADLSVFRENGPFNTKEAATRTARAFMAENPSGDFELEKIEAK